MLIITFELKSTVKCPFDIKKYLLYISPWTYVFSLNKLNYSERKKNKIFNMCFSIYWITVIMFCIRFYLSFNYHKCNKSNIFANLCQYTKNN